MRIFTQVRTELESRFPRLNDLSERDRWAVEIALSKGVGEGIQAGKAVALEAIGAALAEVVLDDPDARVADVQLAQFDDQHPEFPDPWIARFGQPPE